MSHPTVVLSPLALIILAAGLSVPYAADLEIVSASPRGALAGVEPRRVQIAFSSAMVPLAAPDLGDRPPEWVRVEPPLLARWRWAGTSVLIAEPRSKLPRATTYEITVSRDATALDGGSLGRDFTFRFSTATPAVTITGEPPEGVDPYDFVEYWGRPESVAAAAAILLVWDQPVDGGSVAEHLGVRIRPRPVPDAGDLLPAAERRRLERDEPEAWRGWEGFLEQARGAPERDAEFSLEPDGKYPQQVFRIRPHGAWPVASSVEVRVRAGVRALEGPDRGAHEETAVFAAPWPHAPLRFAGRTPAPGRGFDPGSVTLAFARPVRWQDLSPFFRWRRKGEKEWRTVQPSPEAWWWTYPSEELRLFPLAIDGGRGYEVCLGRGAPDADGQPLGFPWCGEFATAHAPPRFHLVQGNGVVEWDGPHLLPLGTTNVTAYRVRHERLSEDEIVPSLRQARRELRPLGPNEPADLRRIPGGEDRRIVSPVDLDPALRGSPGIVRSVLEVAGVVPDSEYDPTEAAALRMPRASLTQVTDLGLTVKTSRHEGVLAWVTALRDGRPVEGAVVRVRDEDNRILWEGATDRAGLARSPAGLPKIPFLVTARRGEDVAYARADWTEGHRGWEFNLPVDWRDRAPVVGTVWPDRGVVRPGESLRVKAAVRRQDERRLRPPESRRAVFVVRDSRGQDEVVKETTLDEWGGGEIEIDVPRSAALGAWDVLVLPEYRPAAEAPPTRPQTEPWEVTGSFRVAEFRRPKFRVGVAASRERLVAGDALEATVEGSFLAGGFMAAAPARWSVRASRSWTRPPGKRWEDFEFLPVGFDDPHEPGERVKTVAQETAALDGQGRLAIRLPRAEAVGRWPTRLEIEAEVEDVDRQSSAGRTRVEVMPGEFQIGVRRPGYFVEARDGVATAIVALGPDGTPIAGASVRVEVVRRRWESVRRRDASGRYDFESRAVDEKVEGVEVATGPDPVEVRFGLVQGGCHVLVARAVDPRGNEVEASTSFYVFGEGYSPWRLDRENRIELVPERESYAPGETARILVQSPWERATALVTVERAGVMEARVEELAGTMPLIEVAVGEDHVPNAFVSVVLLRGRIPLPPDPEMADPGRPAYRVGYCELAVPPRDRRLAVRLDAGRGEYRPGDSATARVRVEGADGSPRRASVTLWAVDAGVLSLTGYRAPDLLATFYVRRGLGVATGESRSRLVGRRSYGTKADRAGGGGGGLEAAEDLRTDFRAVAVWRGDVVTDADGAATVGFTLPDSLTTYRLMAVAMAGAEEFGAAEVEFRVTKPLGLEPALPRFLRPGDRARAGVVLRNRTGEARAILVRASVTAGGAAVSIAGAAERTVEVPAGGSVSVPFDLAGREAGAARLRFEAASAGPAPERDALELELPVIGGARLETAATFFSTSGRAVERVTVPPDAYPSSGGLEVRVAPTALVPAAAAAGWLAGYPHRCAEQISSRLLGMLAAERLGGGFAPGEVDGLPLREWASREAGDLAGFQRAGGGFAFWQDFGEADEVLTSHVAWALAEARRAGVAVDSGVLDRAAEYLSRTLRKDRWPWGEDDGWTPRVLAALALARLGRAEPGYHQLLHDRRVDSKPVWARALLATAMLAVDANDPRAGVLLQEVQNALALEAQTAALEEPEPEWGWRVWWSARRGTSAALLALLAGEPASPTTERLARGLLDHLANDRFFTTQDAAWMLQSLAAYRERHEPAPAEGTARVALGGDRLLDATLEGPESGMHGVKVAMADLMKRAGKAGSLPLVVKFEGRGLAHVSATLSHAPREAGRAPVSAGLTLERRFLDDGGRATLAAGGGDPVTIEVVVGSSAGRRFVVVEVPIPAGLEPVDPELATTATPEDAGGGAEVPPEGEEGEFIGWSDAAPGFDHVELRDDRIVLYASHLPAGSHVARVPCRATLAGSFTAAPAHAELMYAPEIFGTTSAAAFEVAP